MKTTIIKLHKNQIIDFTDDLIWDLCVNPEFDNNIAIELSDNSRNFLDSLDKVIDRLEEIENDK